MENYKSILLNEIKNELFFVDKEIERVYNTDIRLKIKVKKHIELIKKRNELNSVLITANQIFVDNSNEEESNLEDVVESESNLEDVVEPESNLEDYKKYEKPSEDNNPFIV